MDCVELPLPLAARSPLPDALPVPEFMVLPPAPIVAEAFASLEPVGEAVLFAVLPLRPVLADGLLVLLFIVLPLVVGAAVPEVPLLLP